MQTVSFPIATKIQANTTKPSEKPENNFLKELNKKVEEFATETNQADKSTETDKVDEVVLPEEAPVIDDEIDGENAEVNKTPHVIEVPITPEIFPLVQAIIDPETPVQGVVATKTDEVEITTKEVSKTDTVKADVNIPVTNSEAKPVETNFGEILSATKTKETSDTSKVEIASKDVPKSEVSSKDVPKAEVSTKDVPKSEVATKEVQKVEVETKQAENTAKTVEVEQKVKTETTVGKPAEVSNKVEVAKPVQNEKPVETAEKVQVDTNVKVVDNQEKPANTDANTSMDSNQNNDNSDEKTLNQNERAIFELNGNKNLVKISDLSAKLHTPSAEAPPQAQLADNVKINLSEGKTEFEMQLTPHNLGKITVKMVAENGMLSIEFIADNPKTQSMLMANASEIRDLLQSTTSTQTQIVTANQPDSMQQNYTEQQTQQEQHEQEQQEKQNDKENDETSTVDFLAVLRNLKEQSRLMNS